MYEDTKVIDIETIKVERPKSEYNDGPPCIELMAQNKVREVVGTIVYLLFCLRKSKLPNNWKKG